MMMTCPDLVALAGDRYRVTWETPLDTRPSAVYRHDPWGPDTLAVFIEGHRGALADRLVAAGCTLRTEGTDGRTLLFPAGLFSQVAELAGARKRRHANPATIQRGREVLARLNAQRHAQSDFRGPVCPQTPSVDILPVQAAG